jgi:hypothetical protein
MRGACSAALCTTTGTATEQRPKSDCVSWWCPAIALLNDMQGKGHIDELKLLKAMQLLVNAVQALAAQK